MTVTDPHEGNERGPGLLLPVMVTETVMKVEIVETAEMTEDGKLYCVIRGSEKV